MKIAKEGAQKSVELATLGGELIEACSSLVAAMGTTRGPDWGH